MRSFLPSNRALLVRRAVGVCLAAVALHGIPVSEAFASDLGSTQTVHATVTASDRSQAATFSLFWP